MAEKDRQCEELEIKVEDQDAYIEDLTTRMERLELIIKDLL